MNRGGLYACRTRARKKKTNKDAGSVNIRRNRRVRAASAARCAFRLSIRLRPSAIESNGHGFIA
ncbi:hypothetical protein CO709_17915 [Burkholderia thailandensis]|nr:hypothetical protein CO709_17915 [Burkholderia thailandensis]